MSFFMQSGDKFVPMPSKDSLLEGLPVGTFSIETSMSGPYFARQADAEEVTKVYGNTDARADRIIRTYQSRKSSTGVLLCGEKGSGKSLLARLISQNARTDHQMPTIFVKGGIDGAEIESLLNSLEQSSVVVFDEFEKNFSKEAQGNLLSLLDGTAATKHLFVFTANDKHKINEFMVNRPGRIFYNLTFDALTEEFIREYGNDLLNNKEWVDELVIVSQRVRKINFDMLKSIVEESNRYVESPIDTVNWLNVDTASEVYNYEIVLETTEGLRVAEGTTRGKLYGDLGYPSLKLLPGINPHDYGDQLHAAKYDYDRKLEIMAEHAGQAEEGEIPVPGSHTDRVSKWAADPVSFDVDFDNFEVIEYDVKSGVGKVKFSEDLVGRLTPTFTSYVPQTHIL